MIKSEVLKLITNSTVAILLAGLYGCTSGGIQSVTGEKIAPSEIFKTFENGSARLTCGLSCSGKYGANRDELNRLHGNGLWADLAIKVSVVGFSSEMAYYYLGRSAEGLGKVEAAKTYYKLSLTNEFKCSSYDKCGNLDLPNLTEERLARLDKMQAEVGAGLLQTDKSKTARLDVISGSDNESVPPVSQAEWREEIIVNSQKITVDQLLEKSTALVNQSTQKFKSGNKKDGISLALRSSALTAYSLELLEGTGRDFTQLRAAHENNKRLLATMGLSNDKLESSLVNLKVVVPSAMIPKPEILTVRKPTKSEIIALNKAIKLRLVDPGSARFGEYMIVGNSSACVMVNSRNRYGGYAGASALFMKKIGGEWRTIHDAGSLQTCLVVTQKVN